MLNVSTRPVLMVLLASGFAVLSSGCDSLPNPLAQSPAPSPVTVPVKAATLQPKPSPKAAQKAAQKATQKATQKAAPPRPKPQAPANLPPGVDPFEQALDTAAGAKAIGESALSRDDWKLAANHWKEAIQLLQAVPTSHRNYNQAQQKLKQFRTSLTLASRKAAPPAKPKAAPGPSLNPAFFRVPIKYRLGGIPVVEVTFNGRYKADMLLDTGASGTLITLKTAQSLRLRPIGTAQAKVASGEVIEFYVAKVGSVSSGGRMMKNVRVGIAPPDLQVGLLGQDFYWNYDMTIKQDVVEFRRQREVNML